MLLVQFHAVLHAKHCLQEVHANSILPSQL